MVGLIETWFILNATINNLKNSSYTSFLPTAAFVLAVILWLNIVYL